MWSFRRAAFALPAAAVMTFAGAAPARAHAFGPRYDLPLPLARRLYARRRADPGLA